ncbi:MULTISPECIES: DUF418 domain-containing protein [unclassified Streptomyces]|uniref:DUF418 domain-containing protein n=1 Tax=unclassified Streptomyces TaxID=2593676 RepID=UPI000DB98343|nr:MULTISPECIES: DUF418 domain-containing protein [unclassified Streptomyces]MYT73032.1 DUF418 domain-containing protein [Streptomyces sp. SID8367]RAJ73828.1 putative membrane protein YeiB [Streptomyces sp. PsTaAH-137]
MTDEGSPVPPHAALREAAAVPSPLSSAAASPRFPTRTPAGRLIGVDLARGLAVFGMYAVHVGPDPSVGGPLGFLMEAARGRAATLFGVLAGFSLIIIMGRRRPRRGRAGRRAAARIVIRSVLLIALGYALTALDTTIEVILSFYGLLFLLLLPLYRLRARTLGLLAAAGALLMPQILYAIRVALDEGSWGDALISWDPLARITDTDGFVELLFTGEYPVLTWAPFLLAGMAVARLDLSRPRIRSRLALTGAGLAVLGYGGSWLALRLVPGASGLIASATDGGSASSAWWSDAVGDPYGAASTPLSWLLVAAPHSQTTFWIVGNTGVALVVLAGCLFVVDRMPRLTRAAAPVAAVGTMALTVYALHIVALWLLTDVWYVPAADSDSMAALPMLLAFIAGAMLLAVLWTARFRRGPLELLLHTASLPARRLR